MFPGSINKNNQREIHHLNNINTTQTQYSNIDLNETHEFNKYMNTNTNIEPPNLQNTNNKKYNYNILNLLQTDTDFNIEPNTVIHICSYRIITTELYPILMYLLYKDPKLDTFNFPSFKYSTYINPVLFAETFLYNLLNFNQILINTEEQNVSVPINYNTIFKGFLHENNELFLFFDSTNCENNIYDVYKKNKIWYGLIDEIINQQHICNFKIDSLVTNFFINNIDIIYLKDENNINYEIPIVAYSGQPDNNLNFTYTFGVTKKKEHAFMGPYYYFTDYTNSIYEGGWSSIHKSEFKNNKLITEGENGKYIKGGIVRFAIFLGINKIVLNNTNDETDKSSIKQTLLNDNTSSYEYLTTRITDYDGKWADSYDSVYIGKLKLDDETYMKKYPYWVLKKYEQQLPLSFHYINKKTLGETFQENENYLIL